MRRFDDYDWFEDLRQRSGGVDGLLKLDGVEVLPRGHDRSFVCPCCQKERRHTRDGKYLRHSARITPKGGWVCEPCGAKGDVVNLAVALAMGEPGRFKFSELSPFEKDRVREWCVARGLCASPRGEWIAKPKPMVRAPAPRVSVAAVADFPPAEEVVGLWGASLRLDALPGWDDYSPAGWMNQARAYLVGRGFDVGILSLADLARILPPEARLKPWPKWWPPTATYYRPALYRLAVPMYAIATGELATMQARAVVATDGRKTTNPVGFGVGGACFADERGRALLRGQAIGPGVVVPEGLTDFLAAAQLAYLLPDSERPAVVGVVNGSAGPLGARLVRVAPHGYAVRVATDNDAEGEKYTDALERAFGRGVERATKRARLALPGGPVEVGELVVREGDAKTDADRKARAEVVALLEGADIRDDAARARLALQFEKEGRAAWLKRSDLSDLLRWRPQAARAVVGFNGGDK